MWQACLGRSRSDWARCGMAGTARRVGVWFGEVSCGASRLGMAGEVRFGSVRSVTVCWVTVRQGFYYKNYYKKGGFNETYKNGFREFSRHTKI